jgi:hypothetical protein
MKRWDFEKNSAKGIQPTEITQSSNIEVYWRCEHGHEYKSSPKREKKAVHCSLCYEENKSEILSKQTLGWRFNPHHTLADAFPNIVKEWDYKRNANPPSDYTPGANKSVSIF